MSHFAVMVIGPNVEAQLAPYHEFECTGNDDQYVQDVDETEEARDTFNKHMTTRYRDPEGNLVSPYNSEGNHNPMFWRELTPEEEAKFLTGSEYYQDYDEKEHGIRLYTSDHKDGEGSRTRAFAWPSEGWTVVEVPESTVRTFAEFCEEYYGHKIVPFGGQPNFDYTLDEEGRQVDSNHKYGYTIVDENGEVVKTIDRTNPDRKWDWYSVGGRWNGYFKLKPMTMGVLGTPGLQTMNSDYEPAGEDRADMIMKGDIDIDGMRWEAGEEAAKTYNTFLDVTRDLPLPLTWKQVQERNTTDGKVDWGAAREQFNSQPMIEALRSNRETIWFDIENFMCSKETYVERARNGALATFAVVKDGKWYQRGNMGWWGMVSDEEDRDTWYKQFSDLIDGLPDDTLLTVVDCHI
jgi:hypothetical protein